MSEDEADDLLALRSTNTWQTPLLLSFVIVWICQLYGTLLGGVYMILRRLMVPLWPQVRARANGCIARMRWSKREAAPPKPAAAASRGTAAAAATDEEAGTAPLLEDGAPSSTAELLEYVVPDVVEDAVSSAATVVQRNTRALFARKQAKELQAQEGRKKGSRTAPIGLLTKLALFEAAAFGLILIVFVLDLWYRVGPPRLWAAAERAAADSFIRSDLAQDLAQEGEELPAAANSFMQFLAYVGLVFTDGLLLHWQVRFAMYTCVTIGSLVVYLPFLVVRLPLIGKKLTGSLPSTAYDRAGQLRRSMSRFDAFEKWKIEQGHDKVT